MDQIKHWLNCLWWKGKKKRTHSSNFLIPSPERKSFDPKLTHIHSVKWLTSLHPFCTKACVRRCWNVTTRARAHTHCHWKTPVRLSAEAVQLFCCIKWLVQHSLAGQQPAVSALFLSYSIWQAVLNTVTTLSAGHEDILIRGWTRSRMKGSFPCLSGRHG